MALADFFSQAHSFCGCSHTRSSPRVGSHLGIFVVCHSFSHTCLWLGFWHYQKEEAHTRTKKHSQIRYPTTLDRPPTHIQRSVFQNSTSTVQYLGVSCEKRQCEGSEVMTFVDDASTVFSSDAREEMLVSIDRASPGSLSDVYGGRCATACGLPSYCLVSEHAHWQWRCGVLGRRVGWHAHCR